MWQEASAPGGRFFCGKKTLRRAEDFFVARSLCAGRKIFLWQESPEPGAGFDKTYNFFNFFFSVPPFSLLPSFSPFSVSPLSLSFFSFFRSFVFAFLFFSSPFFVPPFLPSCFPSFLFSFSSPFFLSSSLSLVISLNSFSFYFCIVALPSCRLSFLLSLGSDERQKTETTGSKKTETTERKKRSDERQKTETTDRKKEATGDKKRKRRAENGKKSDVKKIFPCYKM